MGSTKSKFHYGWIVCIVCLLAVFVVAGLAVSAFTVYMPYIMSVVGLERTQASNMVTIRAIAGAIAMLLLYRLLKVFGARKLVAFGIFADAAGFFLFALVPNVVGYYIGGFLLGLGVTLSGNAMVSIILRNWFKSRVGMVTSIAAAGGGLSGIVAPPIITLIIENASVKAAFIIEAIVIVVIGIVVTLLLRNTPQEKGLEPYYVEGLNEKVKTPIRSDFDAGKLIVALICICTFFSGLTVSGTASFLSSLQAEQGFEPLIRSSFVSLKSAMLMIGGLVIGPLADKIGTRWSGLLFCAFYTAGTALTFIAAPEAPAVAYLAMILVGMGGAIGGVGMTLTMGSFSTPESYPKNVRTSSFFSMAGGIAAGTFAGFLAENFGGYSAMYKVGTALFVVIIILLQVAYTIYGKKKAARKV